MLIPTKHEKLNINLIVIGADLIALIKKNPYNLETLFNELKNCKNINLEQFYNTLTFLWLANIVNLDEFELKLKK